jgi:dTDP-4-dehydrorhamnose 3,5-epimerase
VKVDVRKTKIPGCFELQLAKFQDQRGCFVKTFHREVFLRHQLEAEFAEEYYSVSATGVLRGMHVQLPPHDQVKIVHCAAGEVMDVVVDLRTGSPTYGAFEVFRLSAERANMVYMAKGLAHGFYVIDGPAMVMYKATTVHAPEADQGVRWNSLNIPWPDPNPVVSERDRQFPPFHEFVSPFIYEGV